MGGKELEVIDNPHDGYSVEYLQAVLKSAKIYIRSLQQNLDTSQLDIQVYRSLNIVIVNQLL